MNHSSSASAIGVDVGTSRIVTAHRIDEEYRFRTELNAFVELPFSKMTQSVLQYESVLHSLQGDRIVVHGNESERFADMLGIETRRPMSRGVLNPDEPDGLLQMRRMLEALVGQAKSSDHKLCFSVPAAPHGSQEGVTYHEASIRQILADLGYSVRSVNEGLAVVYAELESSNYTGIGVSCGGGLCNVCLSYLSVPVVSFSINKAGDYIDGSAASAIGELANRVRITKEDAFHFNGHFSDKTLQALSVYYDEVIDHLVGAMKEAFLACRSLPKLKRPIPVVLSGGSTMPKGFRDRFEKKLLASDFPIAVSEVRLAADPMSTTAKGALIAAIVD